MVEAKKTPADTTQEISYKYFAEQIDGETGIPVGMVPLEVVFDRGLVSFPQNAKWHDVGAGVFASTKHIASKIPPDVRETMTLVASDPFFDVESLHEFVSQITPQFRDHIVMGDFANSAVVRERDCDQITMINMAHLVSEEERIPLLSAANSSLKADGKLTIVTSFIQNWNVDRRTLAFQIAWLRAKGDLLKLYEYELPNTAFPMWDSDRYIEEVEEAGFEIELAEIVQMPCTVESYRLISKDKEWLENTMPGIPLEIASEVSVKAIGQLIELGRYKPEDSMPRNTLVLVGSKFSNPTSNSNSGTGAKAPVEREPVLV